MMPSKYTSDDSLEDAAECAAMLRCRHDVIPIVPGVQALDEMLDGADGLAAENIQSRLRMVTLMALSNTPRPHAAHHRQQERDVGRLCHALRRHGGRLFGAQGCLQVHLSSRCRAGATSTAPKRGLGPDGPVMPQRVIDKPPTAELRPNQKDEDSLPPYEVLDRILEALIEDEKSVRETAAITGADEALVAEIEKKLLRAEYKRRQAPPGVKIGTRNFGRDRRYPITNAFRTG